MRRYRGWMARLLPLLALVCLLVACGGSSEPGAPPAAPAAPPVEPVPPAAPPAEPADPAPTPPADPQPTDELPPPTEAPTEPVDPPAPAPAPEPPGPVPEVELLGLQELAILSFPLDLTTRSGDDSLYVAQKGGQVWAVSPGGQVAEAPFLDLTDRVTTESERGLLGITFSPDGERFYGHYSGSDGESRLASWAVTNGAIDPASEVQHLEVGQPFENHNGGQIAFGPDGFLYVALGDGGSGGDPRNNGQNPDTLLGALLRISPIPAGPEPYAVPADNPFATGGGAPEVWAFGLRNPWRFSFDRATGDLWIGDVGQNDIEEVDFLAAGTGAGANFGWNRLEGTRRFTGDTPPEAVPPVFEYSRDLGNSITGGYVYRGSAIPSLVGQYVFGDFGSGFVGSLGFNPSGAAVVQPLSVRVPGLTSFGQDQQGELYVLTSDGLLAKLVPAT